MRQLKFPEGIRADSFLEHFWQQKPLFMPAAASDFQCTLTPNELAGLACDLDVESRIVLERDGEKPWQTKHGPFNGNDFAELPDTHWSLLVQDVDKLVPEVTRLLDYFTFIPDWRLDDIMISYAPEGGSVGPHLDEYDVFLVQVRGNRHWQIESRTRSLDECIPGLDLRILPDFNPDYEWTASPGDVLYLPPGVPHYGVSQGDCMTCSVGFRAPQWREMLDDYCHDLLQRKQSTSRFRDTKLRQQRSSAEIMPDVIEQINIELLNMIKDSDAARMDWFGRFITTPKSEADIHPLETGIATDDFFNLFSELGCIERNPHTRFAFTEHADGLTLFASGESYQADNNKRSFLEALCHYRELHFGYMSAWLEDQSCCELLTRLVNAGHLVIPDHD